MRQPQLFQPDLATIPESPGDGQRRLQMLVTVKAAPTPSAAYGETVCVAGVSADLAKPGWFRLYPINFRYLEEDLRFKKYDIVAVDASPNRKDDFRAESWRPLTDSLVVERHLRGWRKRRPWLDPYIDMSMCDFNRAVRAEAHSRSLGLVKVNDVERMDIEEHPGWTDDEQRKIDGYVNQLSLFGSEDRTPLAAPRYRGWYKWRCTDSSCGGHRQGLIDWEFVALQRRLSGDADGDARAKLKQRFVDEICGSANDVAFFVGNQAKHPHTFSVLGVYYPKLKD